MNWKDAIVDVLGLTVEEGLRIFLYLVMMSAVAPLVTVIAVVPYPEAILGSLAYIAFLVLLILGLIYWMRAFWDRETYLRPWIMTMAGGLIIVTLLGAFGAKHLAAVIGMLLISVLGVISAIFVRTGVWVIGGGIALTEALTYKEAVDKATATLRNIFSIIAWEWVIVLVIRFLGPHMSATMAFFLILTAGFLAFAAVGWNKGPLILKDVLYYGAVAGLSAGFIYVLIDMFKALGIWYGMVQLFFWALIPFTIGLVLTYMRKLLLIRYIAALATLYFIFNATVILMVPEAALARSSVDWEAFLTRPSPYQESEILLADAKDRACEGVQAKWKDTLRSTPNPTPEQVHKWTKEFGLMLQQYPECAEHGILEYLQAIEHMAKGERKTT